MLMFTSGHFNSVQEKAANAMVLSSDHVRWVMGPSGTTVTFPDEMGLPSIFDSKPCRFEFLSYKMKVLGYVPKQGFFLNLF
jgi:hypothetical protein